MSLPADFLPDEQARRHQFLNVARDCGLAHFAHRGEGFIRGEAVAFIFAKITNQGKSFENRPGERVTRKRIAHRGI